MAGNCILIPQSLDLDWLGTFKSLPEGIHPESRKLGDSHQLKRELKSLLSLSLGGVLPMLKMVFSA